ncbi:MAG: TadE family protein, partial [Acidimicrobiia bacterium]
MARSTPLSLCYPASSTGSSSPRAKPAPSSRESSVNRPRPSDRGAAAVEMAMVTMFLLVLLLGIVDVGRAISTNISIRDA